MACRRCAQVLAEQRPDVEPLAQHAKVADQVAEALVDDRPIPLAVAQHEIAHLVTAHVVGYPGAFLECIARPTSGSTWFVSPFEGPDDPAAVRDRVMRAITYTLAGGVADERNGIGWPCSRTDVLLVDRYMAQIGHGGGHSDAIAPLRFLAAEIVRDAWLPLIVPLATVLQAQRRLAGPKGVTAFLEKSPEAGELRWLYQRAFASPTQSSGQPVVPGAD
jgi:hypothetical protein